MTDRPLSKELTPHAPLLPELPSPAPLEARAGADWLLGAVLTMGLILRVAHLAALRRSPFFDTLQLDAAAYDEWARQIAGGALIGDRAFWVDPLYAYVLGGLYKLFGHDIALARVLNAAFGVLTAFIVARTALRVWGSRVAQLSAAILCAWFVPALHFEGQAEKTALSVLLIAICIDLFTAGSQRALWGAGVALGLATLTRGNSLLLLPLAVATLAFGWEVDPAKRPPQRQRLWRAVALASGAVALIALATLHNWIAAREFVPTTTNLGINLYLGNNAENAHGYYTPPDFLHPASRDEVPDFRAEATRRLGEPLSDAALSRYWAGQAWRAVLADPGLALARTLRKLELTLHNDELPDSDAVEVVAEWSPVLRAPLWWFGELFPLALLGVLVGFRRRAVRIVAIAALVYALSLLPFFVMGRLRIQLLPPCAILAAGAIAWLAAALHARAWRPLARGGVVLALGALVTCYRPAWMAERRAAALAISWNNLGASFLDRHKRPEAIAAYERAVALSQRAVPAALRALATLYQEGGDYERAGDALRRLVTVRPDSASAHEALNRMYREMLRLGMDERAVAGLQRAVRETPYDEGLHYFLGETMQRHATPLAMIEFFSTEAARDQKPQTSHYFWALGLERSGDLPGAIDHLQRALELDPAHELSQRQWGLWLEGQGKLEEALAHFEEAAAIHPEFRAALADAARVAQRLGRAAQADAFRARAARANPNTQRRFLYWARYLHQHGRDGAAQAELQRMLSAVPNDPEALALRDALGVTGGSASSSASPEAKSAFRFDAAARERLVTRLGTAPAGSATFITYDARDERAHALATDLAGAFEDAHWRVRRIAAAGIALKPGLMLLAAADEPSAACQIVRLAIEVSGLPLSFRSGYREFATERKRADPNYQALTLDPDQDFVLVIGREP